MGGGVVDFSPFHLEASRGVAASKINKVKILDINRNFELGVNVLKLFCCVRITKELFKGILLFKVFTQFS